MALKDTQESGSNDLTLRMRIRVVSNEKVTPLLLFAFCTVGTILTCVCITYSSTPISFWDSRLQLAVQNSVNMNIWISYTCKFHKYSQVYM
jgi:hypothetical protein